MKTKSTEPIFFTGEMYFVENVTLTDTTNFKKEFEDVPYFASWKLDRGTVIPNGDNERLKFDIVPGIGFFPGYFTGFLYPDGKMLGKIKHVQEANSADVHVNGQYKKISKNRILIRGIWENDDRSKEYFWAQLLKSSNK